MHEFNCLFDSCRQAFNQNRTLERARKLGHGLLTCFGRHTITGILSATGQQFIDWSAAYKLFKGDRMDVNHLFDVARQKAISLLPDCHRVFAHLDDTLIRKRGKNIPGAAWRRDPLGPPFHTNFIWGQRFIQISMAVPSQLGFCQSRAIPIDFHHAPSIKKPKKTASEEEWCEFKKQQSLAKLSHQGILRIRQLRLKLNHDGLRHKNLCVSVDGSYTNQAVLQQLPSNTTLIGRIRKDTKLYKQPEHQNARGRKKVYGDQIPTPEQIRQSNNYEYEIIQAWATGKVHDFHVKVVHNLKWRTAGEQHNLQLIIIRPLGYRLTKASKILYREPAYLICTDDHLQINELIQAYLWRWEIEVNFRDEKSLLGCGQAQVRCPQSVEKAPAFTVAMYAFIHLAALVANKVRDSAILPRPRWDPAEKNQRLSTMEIINLFRLQTWSKSIKENFLGFVKKEAEIKSLINYANPLLSATLYIRK